MSVVQGKVVNLLPGMSLGQVINPMLDNSFVDYVKNNFQQNYQMLQDIGASMSDTMQNLFNHFTSNDYVNRARDIAMEVGIKNDASIYQVDCSTIYDSGMTMAGYIMANPVVWDMYSKFRLDGYNDMFNQVDLEETNPYHKEEYMQVMDGVVQFNDDGYQVSFFSYDGNELNLREKMTVLDAWDCAEFLIEQGVDPTSSTKEEL